MKKRIIALFSVIVILTCLAPVPALAAGSLSNFTRVRAYTAGQFTDISGQWFEPYVQTGYALGLINGKTATTYAPMSNLTIAEAVKLAACLHSIYYTGKADFPAGAVWYQPYVDYALRNGILKKGYADYNALATRADFAVILAAALPDEALTAINNISANAIPDVSTADTYGPAVYKLYRAGILTGSDKNGTFLPKNNIRRDEVAAIVVRMADASYRQTVTLAPKELSATEIAAKCTPAVFYIAIYDASGTLISSGSGFFIDSSGLAVTNYHVIDEAFSAKITMTDGKSYAVTGIYDYSQTDDLALIQIGGTGFPYLEIGDSTKVRTGETVYAIGYPQGYAQTFTKGTVTNDTMVMDGFILMDSAISPGSSGGALVNTAGQVIGVPSNYFQDAQNLNLARPIHLIDKLQKSTLTPLVAPIYSISVDPPVITVSPGSQATVTVTEPSGNHELNIVCSVKDSYTASCALGAWSNNTTCPLYVTGLQAGITEIKVSLTGKNGEVLAYTSLIVIVRASGAALTAYEGYYPAPDFGAYMGIEPVSKVYSQKDGSTSFAYRKADVSASDCSISDYIVLLYECGFVLYDAYDDRYGNLVSEYVNSDYRIAVTISFATLNNVDCVVVTAASY